MNRDWTERLETTLTESNSVKQLANASQKVVSDLLTQPRQRPIKNLLNGTWLEHPLHPVLTDVPVGAWTATMLLDLLSLVFGVKRLGKASGATTGLGVAAALGAAVTGFADWVDVDPPELAVGIVHAIANITATTLFAISFLVRWNSHWRVRKGAFIPAFLGYGAVTVGAYIGGSLVFRQGVMINRNAYRSGPNDFVPALPLDRLAENTPTRVDVQGRPVLLVRRGDAVYALGAVCSHYGGPLEEGKLQDGTIQCPWHYSQFALADGSVKAGPATAPVPAYEARINNNQVEVRAVKN